jgi:hypothetical protein
MTLFWVYTCIVYHMCGTWSWRTYEMHSVPFQNQVWQLAEAWPGSSKPRAKVFWCTMEKLLDTLLLMSLQNLQEKSAQVLTMQIFHIHIPYFEHFRCWSGTRSTRGGKFSSRGGRLPRRGTWHVSSNIQWRLHYKGHTLPFCSIIVGNFLFCPMLWALGVRSITTREKKNGRVFKNQLKKNSRKVLAMAWKHLPRWFIIIDWDDSCLALPGDDPWSLGMSG